MKHSNFRQVFGSDNPERLCLPELSLVGWARLGKARVPGLSAHVHPDVFEIFFIERGRIEWWVEDEVHRVAGIHVLIHRPGERHGSLGHGMKPCGYLWINLRVDGSPLPGMTPAQSSSIEGALAGLRRRSFPGSPALHEAFRALWTARHTPPPREPNW